MANYKIVDSDKLDADLKRVADAIRAKSGYADPMVFPDEFVQEIGAISTGGGSGSSADVRYVTFMNGDVVLGKKPVAVGDDCADPIARGLFGTPTKESDVQYNYTFYGWGAEDGGAADDNILKGITEDKTVYAIYSKTLRTYTITFCDDDGTVLAEKQVAYGNVPSHTTTKTGWTFVGWTPTPVAVTGDATYTAKWSQKLDFATLTWTQIAEYCEAGRGADFEVGSTKSFQNDNGSYSYIAKIVGTNHDNLADGSGKAGITMVIQGYYPQGGRSWQGGSTALQYPDSNAHSTINNYLNYLPAELVAVLKTVTKKYYNSTNAAIETIDTKAFLPATFELGSNDFTRLEGNKYAYFSDNATRILTNSSGTAVQYWTRTRYDNTYVYSVQTDGSITTKKHSSSTSDVIYAFVCI